MGDILNKNLRDQFFEIISYFGKGYWKLQQILFSLFILGGLVDFSLWICGEMKDAQELLRVFLFFQIWVCVFTLTTTSYFISKKIFNLDIRIYYNFWIPKMAPFFCRFDIDKSKRVSDIIDSKQFSEDKKTPTFVKREHLMRLNYWPYWSFSIVTILNPGKVKQEIVYNQGERNWVLSVDLRGESYGIYSNAGKKFLSKQYASATTTDLIQKKAEEFDAFMYPNNHPGKSFTWGEIGETIPLRWASGGFLPIVNYKKKNWVQLFVRDIFPVGLNVANGASENKDEYKNIHKLIGREFSEETILLSATPRVSGEIVQSTFEAFTLDPRANSPIAPFINPKFAEKQNQLRFEHDGIKLMRKEGAGRKIRPIETPFKLQVTYHKSDLKSPREKKIENVIYSVNPSEFGIEVVWLCNYDLKEGEYILDGEYQPGRDVLIRRPVILIDMDYLKGVYNEHGGLGQLLNDEENRESRGCKLLPPIPKGSFEVFDVDVKLRHHRLAFLKNELKKERNSSVHENITWEIKRIERWFDMYEEDFKKIKTSGIESKLLRSLCPVTWKTLEMIFAHNIKYGRG